MMTRWFVGLLLAAAASACSASHTRIATSLAETAGAEFYGYDSTAPTDSAFSYAQNSAPNVFEWKTVTMRFEPTTVFEGNRLKFFFDVTVENGGTRSFGLDDFSAYVALPDESGDWNYRMLFTQSKLGAVPPNARVKVRYFTQLYGMAPPDKMVFVMQSFFGGHDAGFAFMRRPGQRSR